MHTDSPQHDGADAIVAAAKARGVPVVSAKQMLNWLDGRNVSAFAGLGFSSNVLQFSIQPGSGANGLQAMLPVEGPTGALTGVKRGGSTVTTTTRTVRGIDYVAFDAVGGAYTATYGEPPVAPAPETSITDFSVSGRTATASFASDVPGVSFQCRLDGGGFTACGSPVQLTGLADGAHTSPSARSGLAAPTRPPPRARS